MWRKIHELCISLVSYDQKLLLNLGQRLMGLPLQLLLLIEGPGDEQQKDCWISRSNCDASCTSLLELRAAQIRPSSMGLGSGSAVACIFLVVATIYLILKMFENLLSGDIRPCPGHPDRDAQDDLALPFVLKGGRA
jgi:hypothetical protein